jgi:dihydroxyacid dehydratase/phosphogluconate dehydratase
MSGRPTATVTGFYDIVRSDPSLWEIRTAGAGPRGRLPLTPEMLRESPSGDIFGLTQNAGMGWDPRELGRPQFLMLSTQGGIRAADGRPIALGYHTGHWEIGLLMQAAAEELAALGGLPFAGFCSDPCDGRTQGTPGMMDSLAYRNDAAVVLRRLARSLPTRRGVLGVATCDKGLPAMMMALAALGDLPCVLVPGGVTLPPTDGEDAGTVQSIGARSRTASCRWTGRRSWAAGPAARPAAAVNSWAPRRPRRSSGRRSGCRCRTPRWRRRGSRCGWTWPGARRGP